MKKLVLGLLICAVISAPAVATITITSDPYYLTYGQDWTYQAWSLTAPPPPPAYSLGATGIPADDGYINNPRPTADVALTEGEDMPPPGWWDKLDESGHTGLIFGSTATIDLHIANVSKPLPWEKTIQVEVVYHIEEYVPGHGYIDASSYVTAENAPPYRSVSVDDKALTDGWRDVTITWSGIPQIYDSETIRLYFVDTGVAIDSIAVATVCIPEPTTLLLLGGAGLIGWMKKRRAL